MNIYVGNLPYSVDEDQLRGVFERYGEVESISIIRDRETGRPKGFGFVEMPNNPQAEEAIRGLDGQMIDGDRGPRAARVNEARPRRERRGLQNPRW